MKKKLILLTLMMSMGLFLSPMLKAQTDAFFTNYVELRNEDNSGTSNGGLSFYNYTGNSNVPVGNGMFMMAATGVLYLISKRRNSNK